MTLSVVIGAPFPVDHGRDHLSSRRVTTVTAFGKVRRMWFVRRRGARVRGSFLLTDLLGFTVIC